MPELIQALNNPNPLVRLNAAELLGKQPGKASQSTAALIKLLSDNGEYIPPQNPYGFTEPLALSEDYYNEYWTGKPLSREQFVRVNAAIALGSLGSTEAIPALKLGLKDSNPKMQIASAWALTRLKEVEIVLPVLSDLVTSSNPDIQSSSLRLLKATGAQGAKYILPALLKQFDASKPESRENIVLEFRDLGAAGLPAVSRLRETLEGPDVNARGYAATVLANIYEDLARQNIKGDLSKDDRRLATKELEKILQIVTKPGAKFNKPPVDRLRTAQTKL
ncbi:MAG: hypothetical protein HC860_23935 [Alkalinema sp. RU_4_3]|nr:hypothetical protein [Alkalinema sp. RU_4_3]